MNYHVLYLLMIATVGLGGCSSIKTHVERPEQSAPPGNTYAFLPIKRDSLDQASAVLYDEIRQRIAHEMQQRRYTVDAEDPQLLIAFTILTDEQRKEVTRSSDPYGSYDHMWMNAYSGGWWPPMTQPRYKEVRIEKTGILVVDAVAAPEKELLWRGVGTGPVNDPEERFETSYRIIARLFRKFPKASTPSVTQ